MKTYYYTIRENKAWDEAPQKEISLKSWKEFAKFCNKLSKELKKEIRGCETSGYNNQGHYFYNY